MRTIYGLSITEKGESWSGIPVKIYNAITHSYPTKERQYEQDRQKYRFIPGYYEWVLVDEKGRRLYCIPDADEMCVTDGGNTCTLEEVRNNVESDLETEKRLCSIGEEDVHLLVGLDELPKSAVEIMARALYDYYCLD